LSPAFVVTAAFAVGARNAVLCIGAETAMLRFLVPEAGGTDESVTRIVKAEVPGVVGVPVIVPVEALSERPPGSEPVATDHV
jgi:hypothetical protein